MFTGLVEAKGSLVRRTSRGADDARLTIEGVLVAAEGALAGPIELGESIAVDGVCLTVDTLLEPGGPGRKSVFEVDASSETLSKTTLGALRPGASVNLERAMRVGGRLGGHLVTGHVDGVGHVVERSPIGGAIRVVFEAPPELARFIAPKGSICIGGVSLTVNGVDGARFDVALIPHTLEKTSLEGLAAGTRVNLEVDILARYVARLLEHGRSDSKAAGNGDTAWIDRLTRAGYM